MSIDKEFDHRLDKSPIFPNRSRGSCYYLDVIGEYSYPDAKDWSIGESMYFLKLDWNGIPSTRKFIPAHKRVIEFTFFLIVTSESNIMPFIT